MVFHGRHKMSHVNRTSVTDAATPPKIYNTIQHQRRRQQPIQFKTSQDSTMAPPKGAVKGGVGKGKKVAGAKSNNKDEENPEETLQAVVCALIKFRSN